MQYPIEKQNSINKNWHENSQTGVVVVRKKPFYQFYKSLFIVFLPCEWKRERENLCQPALS
jgi:hypothetical protein